MSRLPLTVTIVTLNEEKNLPRTVESVRFAQEILVVDSGSTDGTVELAKRLGAKVIHNPWPGYGQQKNFAQDHATHDWILNLDADEVVSPELALEIQEALENPQAKGFRMPRKTFYCGKWIQHGGWYPNYLMRMANRKSARWTEPQVHEYLDVKGEARDFKSPLLHYSFNSIHDQIETNLRFSALGTRELRRQGRSGNILQLVFKPAGKFIETYWIKRGFLDGLAGFIISVNAAYSMFLKYAYLLESDLKDEDSRHR